MVRQNLTSSLEGTNETDTERNALTYTAVSWPACLPEAAASRPHAVLVTPEGPPHFHRSLCSTHRSPASKTEDDFIF